VLLAALVILQIYIDLCTLSFRFLLCVVFRCLIGLNFTSQFVVIRFRTVTSQFLFLMHVWTSKKDVWGIIGESNNSAVQYIHNFYVLGKLNLHTATKHSGRKGICKQRFFDRCRKSHELFDKSNYKKLKQPYSSNSLTFFWS